MISALLGGIGLFLLGMSLLTDGLQHAAGDKLRALLGRSTRTPLAGLGTGALVTALVQSSSATTLATIGFVGAGLLTLGQAIGLIYGANLGTTATAWIIATLGLKLSMSTVMLPLVGLGALGRLLLAGRRAALAEAVAGFGLIFVGIDILQGGMASLAQGIDPARFAGTGIGANLLLVLIGIVMTVVMQSSSAAVATTLAAVDGGALGLQQAAAVVIGQNVGTTITAVIGAAGAPIAARRLAGAHVAFNLGTALVALAMLPAFVGTLLRWIGAGEPALALAAFHTAFNLFGVLLFLPLTPRLVRLLTRWIPDPGRALTRRLSRSGAGIPAVAVENARLATGDMAAAALETAADLIGGKPRHQQREAAISEALTSVREYLRPIHSDPSTPVTWREHVAVLHALDHIGRLREALGEEENLSRARAVRATLDPEGHLDELLRSAAGWALAADQERPPSLQAAAGRLAERRRRVRRDTLAQTATGQVAPDAAEAQLEAARWIDRIGYHAWRIQHHLAEAAAPQADLLPAPLPEEPDMPAVAGEEATPRT